MVGGGSISRALFLLCYFNCRTVGTLEDLPLQQSFVILFVFLFVLAEAEGRFFGVIPPRYPKRGILDVLV